MQKRSSKSEDPNRRAFQVVGEATQEHDGQEQAEPAPKPKKKRRKDPAAVALGRKGGKKGGKARAAKLTPEQRSEIARKAAAARWKREQE